MQQAWKEFRTTWRETPWSFSLLLALLPFALVAALGIDVAIGRVHVPSKDVATVATGVGSLLVGALIGQYARKSRERLQQLVAVARPNASAPHRQAGQSGPNLAGQKGGQSGGKR